MMQDIPIKLNPYFAKSKNLIEKFIIIGYKEENILKFLSNNVEGNNKLILSIISEFKLNSFECYESNFLIRQVYPEDPNIILVSNSISKPTIVNITFYSCVDTEDRKKNTMNYFALKFHEKYINYNTNKEYYIPKAYLIVSQYPYFTLYHQICSYILKNNENNKIPIEVLIYYLINNIPSPINNQLTFINFKSYTLPKINGSPYIDFNIFKVLNVISINSLMKIFILIILEIDLLIFSPNQEKLNIFMIMLTFLNYPLFDSTYFWHNLTFSTQAIIDEIERNHLFSKFYGVNGKFKDFDCYKLKEDFFCVDLDNEKNLITNITINNQTNIEKNERISKLLEYIDKILNNKKVKSYFLFEIITSIKNSLKKLKEYTINISPKIQDSFFYIDNDIMKINRIIQNIFFEFKLKLAAIIYKNLNYNIDTLSIKEKDINQNEKFSEEEILFIESFKNTGNYNNLYHFYFLMNLQI